MSKNRYGRIYHSDHRYINLRFKSLDARRVFEAKFNRYHAEHDHDGEPPRFKEATAAEIGNMDINRVHDVDSVTIDGYATYEIEEYHEDDGLTRHHRYEPPTCCVAPIISIKRKFVESDTLVRHELSAVFGDMPDEDYQHLLDSVNEEGFIDPIIRLLGNEVLDGWHRYRAGKELNLLRKLRFQQWDTEKEGDPAAFAFARNIERRHLTPGQRAQIVVVFNERYEHGGDRSKSPNSDLKTRKDLAKKAGVGTTTIDRATQVEKEGESQAVISGEKTAGEVLKAREAEQKLKRKKKKLKAMWDTRIQASRDYLSAENAELSESLELPVLEDGFARYHEPLKDAFMSGIKRYELAKGDFARFQDSAEEVSLEDVEKECKAISIYAHDIANYRDADWIQKMSEAKKAVERVDPEPDAEPSDDRLREDLNNLVDFHGEKTTQVIKMDSWVSRPDATEELVKSILDDIYQERFGKKAYPDPEPAEETEQPSPEPDSEPEPDTVDSLWEKITPAISAWKAARKGEGVGRASKTMFINAVTCFDSELSRDSQTDVLLLKKLLDLVTEVRGPCHTFARYVKMQVDGASIWEKTESDEETEESDEVASEVSPQPSGCEDTFARNSDTSLAEINNLPAVNYFLETLLKQVGTIEHPTDRDELSVAVFDLFVEKFEDVSEREQLSILIDVAYTIVNESL
ncbi:MAG: hypothetical protein OXN25_01495 [Candidatus Poribacteria bacterium]|nr:hypothetical protein [Candidatus Poribacteria bacterium]